MSKEIIELNVAQFRDVDLYMYLDAEIKRLEAMKAELKADYVKVLEPVWMPDCTYKAGPLTFTARQTVDVNQMNAYKAFSDPALRDKLFPKILEFKAGKDKVSLTKLGLADTSWSAPVLSIKRDVA